MSAFTQIYTVQLHNPRKVPAEWSVKRPAVDSPKLRDWAYFVSQPAEGTLEPGGRTNIRVVFTPQLGRDAPYSLALPIKIAHNPRTCEVMCSGRGITPRLELSCRLLDCGVVLPATAGQRLSSEATMTLSNSGSRPIEVVCLDLDAQHAADEEALRSLDMCVQVAAHCSCTCLSLAALMGAVAISGCFLLLLYTATALSPNAHQSC